MVAEEPTGFFGLSPVKRFPSIGGLHRTTPILQQPRDFGGFVV
jgi:hypothetical protein